MSRGIELYIPGEKSKLNINATLLQGTAYADMMIEDEMVRSSIVLTILSISRDRNIREMSASMLTQMESLYLKNNDDNCRDRIIHCAKHLPIMDVVDIHKAIVADGNMRYIDKRIFLYLAMAYKYNIGIHVSEDISNTLDFQMTIGEDTNTASIEIPELMKEGYGYDDVLLEVLSIMRNVFISEAEYDEAEWDTIDSIMALFKSDKEMHNAHMDVLDVIGDL